MASDPALALKAASRDGLLTYRGFVAPDGYEVEVAGRRETWCSAEVSVGVRRLRAIEMVGSTFGVSSRVVELLDDGTHVVVIGELPPVHLAAARVIDWCEGFAAAHRGQDEPHVGVDNIERIAQLFERPELNDQCRMVILGLMHGREQKMTAQDLADRIGELPGVARKPAKKTVVDALGFGSYLAADLREQMIAVFGLTWAQVFGPIWPAAAGDRQDDEAEPLPEMPALALLRRIVSAARQDWLLYVDKPSPNDARWNRKFKLVIGASEFEIPVGQLDAWLDGVAFYHGVGELAAR